MPDLGGDKPRKRSLDLSSVRDRSQGRSEAGDSSQGASHPTRTAGGRTSPGGRQNSMRRTRRSAPPPPDPDDDDVDAVDDEDDDIIAESLNAKKSGKGKNIYVWVFGGIAAVVVIVLFMLFGPRKNNVYPGVDATDQPAQSTAPAEDPNAPVSSQDPSTPGLGIQDFTQNTNNTSDSPLSDPDAFVQDIYGLTTRVDYDVKGMTTATDFVNYVKKRGTWGGGLELYWLECTYRGYKYVVQVPFMYYKELDPEGIIPVKMEILQVIEGTNNETLTIVSYMCLDEAVLRAVLNSAGN